MAHIEQQKFCKKIEKKYTKYFRNKNVLDIGSLDINGNNRYLFENCIYTGLDVDNGNNVDIVSTGHLYSAPNESFDVIISTEVFEHDMFYIETIKNIIRMLKIGGMFIFTCASIGRVEHGTLKTGSSYAAPLLQNISPDWANYYKNLTEFDIRNIEGFNENFPDCHFEYNSATSDLYFFGIKGGMKNVDFNIELNLNSNRIIVEPKDDFIGYIEIFNYNEKTDIKNIIFDRQNINIKNNISYWYQPVTELILVENILVILSDEYGNIVKEKIFNKLNILDAISIKCGTDKSSLYHNYCNKYQKYLPYNRYDNLNLLEIGVLKGESLKMWSEYFFNANILGVDIDNECKKYENERIKIEIGSQNNINFLTYLKNKYNTFDLIIDDGSHIMSDVIVSFEQLFESLNSGGIYIIEDACTSYWSEFGGGINNKNSVIEYFKKLIDDVNFLGIRNTENKRNENFLINLSNEMNISFRTDIESINFMNSVIIITKR